MSESAKDRRAEFEAQLDEVRVRTGAAESDQRWATLGLVLAIVGVVIAVIAFIISGSQGDTRDVLSSVILGLVGVGFTLLGSALFLRYSFARFLRFWLLRIIYEQQADD